MLKGDGLGSLGCLLPGVHDATTTWPGMPRERIAAQCCASTQKEAECFRSSVHFPSFCLAGISAKLDGQIELNTYSTTAAKCASFGLFICGQSCAGTL